MFSFIDFKNVVIELAVDAESKMMIFTCGPLQGFLFSGKLSIQFAKEKLTALKMSKSSRVL